MCVGGRLVADFTAGTEEQPQVPKVVRQCLTTTADGLWVVWAKKVAREWGDRFIPLNGSDSYPADAVAECRRGQRHAAPHPACSCGFHAVSLESMDLPVMGVVRLEVALSGRVLAFDWQGCNVLFRAERQTVMRVTGHQGGRWLQPPEEPGGRLARIAGEAPRGAGPQRLRLPQAPPPIVSVSEDDAGYCMLSAGIGVPEPGGLLVSV